MKRPRLFRCQSKRVMIDIPHCDCAGCSAYFELLRQRLGEVESRIQHLEWHVASRKASEVSFGYSAHRIIFGTAEVGPNTDEPEVGQRKPRRRL